MTALNMREAVRALLLDQFDRLLLVRFEFPAATVWALPGGGLRPGESHTAGLRRELREELGLVDFEIGPHVWSREHVIAMFSGHDGQRDKIHLVRVEHFDPQPEIGWEAMRAEHVHEMRWWTTGEIADATDGGASDDTRPVWFAPRRLAALTRALLADGVPARPIDTGI